MKSKRIIQCFLAALALAGAPASTLHSQDVAPSPPKNPDRPTPMAGGQGLFMAGLGPLGNVLTEEQRTSFRQAMEAHREKMRDTETKLRDARQKLRLAGLDGKFDEAAVRQQALDIGALDAELAVIRARALSQIQPPVSPEQIQKAKNEFAVFSQNAERLRPLLERRHNLTSTNRDENDLPLKR